MSDIDVTGKAAPAGAWRREGNMRKTEQAVRTEDGSRYVRKDEKGVLVLVEPRSKKDE